MGAVADVGGSVVQSQGDIQAGQGAQQSYDYQAQVAANNATIATQNSAYETQLGQSEAGIQALQNRSNLATVVANQGANGLDVNSGSAKRTSEGVQEIGNISTANIVSSAERQSYNYQALAANQTAQSQLDILSGQNAINAAKNKSTAALISGAGSAINSSLGFASLLAGSSSSALSVPSLFGGGAVAGGGLAEGAGASTALDSGGLDALSTSAELL